MQVNYRASQRENRYREGNNGTRWGSGVVPPRRVAPQVNALASSSNSKDETQLVPTNYNNVGVRNQEN